MRVVCRYIVAVRDAPADGPKRFYKYTSYPISIFGRVYTTHISVFIVLGVYYNIIIEVYTTNKCSVLAICAVCEERRKNDLQNCTKILFIGFFFFHFNLSFIINCISIKYTPVEIGYYQVRLGSRDHSTSRGWSVTI